MGGEPETQLFWPRAILQIYEAPGSLEQLLTCVGNKSFPCKSKSSRKSFLCKSKSSRKSFLCKSKSSHKNSDSSPSRMTSQHLCLLCMCTCDSSQCDCYLKMCFAVCDCVNSDVLSLCVRLCRLKMCCHCVCDCQLKTKTRGY